MKNAELDDAKLYGTTAKRIAAGAANQIADEIDDDIPVGRILSRREAMGMLGLSGLVLLAGCGGGSGTVANTTGTTVTTTSGVTSAGAASETSGTTATSTASGTTTTSGGTINLVATPAVT